MDQRLGRGLWILVVGCLFAGCADRVSLRESNAPLLEAIATVAPRVDGPPSPPPPSAANSPYVASPYLNTNGPTDGPPPAPAAAPQPAAKTPSAPPPSAADPASLQQVMAELQSLGSLDPATQQRLLTDLQQTDPALWPMLIQTVRAGMKYRQQQASPPSPNPVAGASATVAEKSTESVEPAGPDPVPPKVSTLGAAAIPALDMAAMTMNPRGKGDSPGLSFPGTTLLSAALAEAQRQETAAATTAPPAVQPASHAEPQPNLTASEDVDWRQTLGTAITALESKTQEPPHSAHEVSRHAWLRVLYLAAGRREDALKPIPGIAAVEQDYWSEQLYALATYLDTEKLSDPARRSAEAAKHLAKATSKLSEASTLTVKNLAFCSEVSSYGVYQKFKSDEFKANQPLILYVEVENFKSDETTKGFHTALRSSYQILDAQGRRVAENDLALTEEYCQNQRRDYFLRYFLAVPERIYAGKYTLQLTIVDTLSQKIGQSSLEFTVTEK